MTYLLVAFVLAATLPMFISSWRAPLVALSIQAVIVAMLATRSQAHLGPGPGGWLELADFTLVRAVAVPLAFALVLKQQRGKDPHFDLIAPNLILWALVVTLVVMAHWFGGVVSGGDLLGTMHVGASGAAVLLGLFVLSNQAQPYGQALGVLALDSGAALLEQLDHSHQPVAVTIALTIVYVWLLCLLIAFIKRLPEVDAVLAQPKPVSLTPALEWETL
jgi:hypothetical protein